MTSTPQTDTSINALDLGVTLGRLEAGQEALKADVGDVRQDLKEVRQDIKFLLRFAWGATAVIALLVVVVPVALTLAESSPPSHATTRSMGQL